MIQELGKELGTFLGFFNHENIVRDIKTRYTSPSRFYHNVSHIEDLYVKLSEVKDQIIDWPSILLAMCYHDAVYDPLKNDNEELSAKLAVDFLKMMGCDSVLIDKVEKYILATKSHVSDLDNDGQLFIDADLSILGSDDLSYIEYSRNIRLEYSMYPDEVYNKGRIAVLKKFLEMPRIFKTKHFFELYEAKAKENITNEIIELEHGIGFNTGL